MMNPRPAPPGLPPEYYNDIDLGCIFHAQIQGNKYIERGLLLRFDNYPPWVLDHRSMQQNVMAEGDSVYLNVQDTTPPGSHTRATKWFRAALISHPTRRLKPITKTQFFIECQLHTYSVEIYNTEVNRDNDPSGVHIRPLVGNEEKKYIRLTGFIEV